MMNRGIAEIARGPDRVATHADALEYISSIVTVIVISFAACAALALIKSGSESKATKFCAAANS
jgi:ATP-dependent protease ClpP protease subunit